MALLKWLSLRHIMLICNDVQLQSWRWNRLTHGPTLKELPNSKMCGLFLWRDVNGGWWNGWLGRWHGPQDWRLIYLWYTCDVTTVCNSKWPSAMKGKPLKYHHYIILNNCRDAIIELKSMQAYVCIQSSTKSARCDISNDAPVMTVVIAGTEL